MKQFTPGLIKNDSVSESLPQAWVVPVNTGGVAKIPVPKLFRVEPRIDRLDMRARLKDSWLGRFYLNHLKQISILRRLVNSLFRTLYVYYIFLEGYFFEKLDKRWRSLIKLQDYVTEMHVQTVKLADAVRVVTPEPEVLPLEDAKYLSAPNGHYDFSPIYVAKIGKSKVYGGTNLVFTHKKVIYHDLYDFARDYTSEELHGRHQINAQKQLIRLRRHDPVPERVPVAAVFVDACALNYAHWLTEVLPRIAAFCTEERFASIPIIVNDGLHQNIMESLYLIIGPDRTVFSLPVDRAIEVDSLYITSVAGYVPFDRRTSNLTGHSQGVFSPSAFEILRNHLSPLAQKIAGELWPEKIFLRRNSGVRKIKNALEIEQLLVAYGYVNVETEKLTFIQQIKLFYNAKEIVSSTGAALANAIFSKLGTKVTVLMSKHENMIYRYWINLLNPFGIKVNYVLGNIIDSDSLGIHSDFAINITDIKKSLNIMEVK